MNTAYQYLLQKLVNTNNTDDLAKLFDAILTEKEQHELANRIRIFALLQKERPQREISDKLGVGIATVSRGAKAYRQLDVDKILSDLAEGNVVENL